MTGYQLTHSSEDFYSENEPDLRRLLHFHTSWSAMEDSECKFFLFSLLTPCYLDASSIAIVTARVLTQALSNMVTANDPLVAKLWDSYMSLPEDQVILMFVFYI